jgi:23S rRNA (uracil1939-C5)-methyltransferase
MKVNIHSMNDFGMGIAFASNKKVFVPYTIQGEEVTISEIEDHGKFLLAAPITINAPSDHRIAAPCEYFAICGGCKLQHMNAELYREFKRNIAKKALSKLGYDYAAVVTKEFFSDYGQRRRTSFKTYIKDRELVFGYFAARTNEIVDISKCLLLNSEINDLIEALKNLVQNFNRRMLELRNPLEISITSCKNGIDILFRSTHPIGDNEKKLIKSLSQNIIRVSWEFEKEITIVREILPPEVSFANLSSTLPSGAFLQVSQESQEFMISYIMSQIDTGSKILDLFSGIGTYSIPLSRDNTIYAVEGDDKFIDSLRNKHNIGIEQRDLYKNPIKRNVIDKFDFAIINPPRNGATPQIIELSKSNVKKVIAVYCDIQAFVRDCKVMIDKGWKISDLAVIDQFYQSHHLEIICILKKATN